MRLIWIKKRKNS